MGAIDEVLAANARFAEAFDRGGLPAAPARKLAVVACMDARLDIHRLLGCREGDVHVIRNAGGAVTDDVIRSLVISQRLLGTEEIMLIHHTACGMTGFRDEDLRGEIEREIGIRPPWAAEAFADVEQDVRQSLARIHASPFISRKASVRGFIYDVETGRLHEIAAH